MSREFPARFLTLFLIVLALGNVLAARAMFAERAALAVFAAGKGRAALLSSGQGRLLIDAGSDASVLRALGALLPPWSRRIDAILLTSGKGGGGLAAVAGRYAVGPVLRFGTDVPYGSRVTIAGTALVVEAPGRFRIGNLEVSSTTPPGSYGKW